MCSKVEDKTTKTGCRSKACFVYLYVCGFFWFLKKKYQSNRIFRLYKLIILQ